MVDAAARRSVRAWLASGLEASAALSSTGARVAVKEWMKETRVAAWRMEQDGGAGWTWGSGRGREVEEVI